MLLLKKMLSPKESLYRSGSTGYSESNAEVLKKFYGECAQHILTSLITTSFIPKNHPVFPKLWHKWIANSETQEEKCQNCNEDHVLYFWFSFEIFLWVFCGRFLSFVHQLDDTHIVDVLKIWAPKCLWKLCRDSNMPASKDRDNNCWRDWQRQGNFFAHSQFSMLACSHIEVL